MVSDPRSGWRGALHQGFAGVKESLEHYVEEEVLSGDNQYQTETHGKQARSRCRSVPQHAAVRG